LITPNDAVSLRQKLVAKREVIAGMNEGVGWQISKSLRFQVLAPRRPRLPLLRQVGARRAS
jgi:hypothetical protein